MSRPFKHPKTGVYYFRKVVPDDLRKQVGKGEVRTSLRTKDPREAASRHVAEAAKVAAQWEALRRGPQPITLKEAVALAGEAYKDFQVLEDDPGPADIWWGVVEANAMAQARRFGPLIIGDDDARQRSSMEARFGGFTDHYLVKRGVLTDAEGRSKFMQELARALDDAALKLAPNAGGDYSPDPNADRFPPWTPRQARQPEPQKGGAERSGSR